MRNLKMYLLAILIALITHGVKSQSVKVSSFGTETDRSKMLIRALQSGHDTIIIDNIGQPWLLKPTVLKGLGNKVIILENEVEIQAMPGAFSKTSDALLTFVQCRNIKIYGNESVLCMNKEEYTDGEWRHIISLRGCRDFRIQDVTLRDSGGDGIYIAGSGRGTYSENISIENIKSYNNKRQGLSIISGKNIHISNSLFADTKGTLPGAGLDIEPNNEEDIVSNIVIDNCVFRNNYHSGIMLALGRLNGDSSPVSIRISNSILENNHAREHPRSASEIIIDANKDHPVKGNVIFENCVIQNSKWGLFYSRKRADAFGVSFVNCTARNICQDGNWPPVYLEVPDYRKSTGPLGGYTFENFFLTYESAVPFMIVRGSRLGTLAGLVDVDGDVTIEGVAAEDIKYINYSPALNRDVELRVVRKYD